MVPLFGQQHLRRMGRIFQHVVLPVALTAFDLRDLLAYGNHRVNEAIKFGEAFGFGRLDHERACHREAHRGRVKTVVHQALCDVLGGNAGCVLDRVQIEDALMGDPAVATRIQHGVVGLQPAGDIVRV